MTATARGRLGAAVQVMFAGIVGLLSLFAGSDPPTPEVLPRGVVVALIYGLPGVVGWLGAARGSRALLGGAALAVLPGSVIAFSGVTLLFLIPGVLMLSAAIGMRAGAEDQRATGVGGGVVVGALLAALLLGTGASMLFVTEPLCWIVTETPSGRSIEIVPSTDGVPLTTGQSGGCTSAAISLEGVALGLVQGLGALVVAELWSRRVVRRRGLAA